MMAPAGTHVLLISVMTQSLKAGTRLPSVHSTTLQLFDPGYGSHGLPMLRKVEFNFAGGEDQPPPYDSFQPHGKDRRLQHTTILSVACLV